MGRQMEKPQRGVQQHGENHDAQRQNIGLAEPLFHAQADKQRRREQLQNRVQAVQPGNHRRIVLQDKDNEVGKDRGKQPFCAETAEIHPKMFAEHA